MSKAWHQDLIGAYTGIDWSKWSTREVPVDPYLVWADICGASGYAAPDPADPDAAAKWPLIVELKQKDLPVQDLSSNGTMKVPWIFGCMEIPQAYIVENEDSWNVDGTFITANVRPDSINHLLCSAEIVRFQLGIPRIPRYAFGAPPPGTEPPATAAVARTVVGIIDDGCPFAHPAFQDGDRKTRLFGLWDQDHRRKADKHYWREPIDFGYGAELDRSTLLRVAQQSTHDDDEPYRLTRYGSFRLDPDTASSSPFDAEQNPLPQATQVAGSHGASVLALAAGYPSLQRAQGAPLSDQLKPRKDFLSDENLRKIRNIMLDRRPEAFSADDSTANFNHLDAADQWPILFVQLPTKTIADTSGGSLAVHVLDAVRYLRLRASKIPYENLSEPDQYTFFPANALVINLSWGGLGGGHDGSSILEQALIELVENIRLNVSLVVAAGNAHRTEHYAQIVVNPGGSGIFHWTIQPDNPLESYLEIWLPETDVNGGRISDRIEHELIISVSGPSGEELPRVRRGGIWVYGTMESAESRATSASAGPSAGVFFFGKVAQSSTGTMILVALAPTRARSPGSRTLASPGEWRIEVSWGSPDASVGAPVAIQAWCERNDLVYGSRRSQQSRLQVRTSRRELSEFDPELLSSWRNRRPWVEIPRGFEPHLALSSLAHVPPSKDASLDRGQIIVAGGYRLMDGEMSRDSSGGPQRSLSVRSTVNALNHIPVPGRRVGPDVDAPSDLSNATPGIRTIGNRGYAAVRISGTSAAAASVTRALATIAYWRGAFFGDDFQSVIVNRLIELLLEREKVVEGEPSTRGTLTPRADDAFRKGRIRFR